MGLKWTDAASPSSLHRARKKKADGVANAVMEAGVAMTATKANEVPKIADAEVTIVQTVLSAKTNATVTAHGNGQPPHVMPVKKDVSDPSSSR